MSEKSLIIGYHARKEGTYPATCKEAFSLVSDILPTARPCVAMFISGPRNSHLNITEKISRELAERELGQFILFHASYVDIPWQSPMASVADGIFERMDAIIAACAKARADVVVHCTSSIFNKITNKRVMARLCESLSSARPHETSHETSYETEYETPSHPRIFVETMPHDPRFALTEQINAIFDDVPAQFISRIGICIDTAHVWAAGADISTRAGCADWLRCIRSDIPVAMHLNDSKNVIGTRTDIHTTLGDGEIWALEDGFAAAIEWARARGALVILERNDDPKEEARKDLRKIARYIN